jgi:hypothetical protein
MPLGNQQQPVDLDAINGVATINGVVLVFGQRPIAGDPADAEADAAQPANPKHGVGVASGSFDELVYGGGGSAADARSRLDQRLQQALDKIDRICGLTEVQKQKLELAGRGDIKRLFDRAERLREECNRSAQVADLDQFRKWASELKSEAGSLSRSFNASPLDSGSLVAKCMKTALTADQIAKYARFEDSPPPYQPPKRRSVMFGGAIELGPPGATIGK